ncbi:MAG: FGGY-family carbohydrate kinase, partial [Anaerolineaceae bacterium]|nr:FGGY-family carbohydrate kinase [Anaerolineaceae bacterium]
MFQQIYKILGPKDFINLKLTGIARTDYSYAAGCGVYNLKAWGYHQPFIQAGGIEADILPTIVPSTEVLGSLTEDAARSLGLSPHTKVVCGGVDNSCMALGAKNIKDGRVYTSLGSSAWIAVSSSEPVIDPVAKPYVFAHVIPGMFTSAVSIFSAGTSFRWVRDNICQDLIAKAQETNQDVYDLMTALAETAPVGSNKLLFNPSLAGGTSQDHSVNLRGAYVGIDLKHSAPELIRAAMEGIAMNLRLRMDVLRSYCELEDEVLLVGGGSKSSLYRQIFADVYNSKILKTNIDQDAGSLGAAAIAAVGIGLWQDFNKIDQIHKCIEVIEPNIENNRKYEQLIPIFESASKALAQISDSLYELKI